MSFVTYNTKHTNTDIGSIVAKIEKATIGIDRDLLIASLVAMTICLSDPSITDDESRFRQAVEKISQEVCYAVAIGQKVDQKDFN